MLPNDMRNSESKLFSNAINSIRMGVEDFGKSGESLNSDPWRSISAVRNLYAGLLLLAKEVLVRRAPHADGDLVIASSIKLVLYRGNVIPEADSSRTIGFDDIWKRFKDFQINLDVKSIRNLNTIRNDAEHKYLTGSNDKARQAISDCLPVVSQLLRLADEDPLTALGNSWFIMLDVKDVYDKELESCKSTFENIHWYHEVMEDFEFSCNECQSKLVEQVDATNTDPSGADAKCLSCGNLMHANSLISNSLNEQFFAESYIAMTDGGDAPVSSCPDCGEETYVFTEGESKCAFCGFELNDSCTICGGPLNPEDVWWNDSSICSYCGHRISKDD